MNNIKQIVLIAYLPRKLLHPPTPAVVPHFLVYLFKVRVGTYSRHAHLKFWYFFDTVVALIVRELLVYF